ncbi:MAG: MFS transporter [Thermodesulforhabdaceae bacterium]
MIKTLQRYRIVLFPVCSFTFTLLFWMIVAFLPLHLRSIDLSPEKAGVVMGVYSIAALIFMIPLGVLSDRVGAKSMLMIGLGLTLLHIAGLYHASEFLALLCVTFIGGIGWAIFQTVLYALFLKVIPEEGKALNISLYQARLFVGFGIGPLLGGLLIQDGGYGLVLKVSALVGVFLGMCFAALPSAKLSVFKWLDYCKDILHKPPLLFLLLYFVYGLHFGVEQSGFSVLMDDLFFSSREIGLVYMAIGIWMGFLAPFAGRWIDVTERIAPFLIGGIVVSSFFHILTAYATSFSGMVIIRLLHTLGDTYVILSFGLLTALLFPEERMGGNSAVVYTVRTLGTFSGNVLTGVVAAKLGISGAFVLSGGVIMVASLVLTPQITSLFAFNRRSGAICLSGSEERAPR